MKFNFLKPKKKSLPALRSLRPQIFAVDYSWYAALGICAAVLIAAILLGLSFFYSQYFESYKDSESAATPEDILNIGKLEGLVERRNEIIDEEVSLPGDPSL